MICIEHVILCFFFEIDQNLRLRNYISGGLEFPHVFSWICQIFVGICGPLKEKTKKSITSGPPSWILPENAGQIGQE